ncbi:unnamed protein product [Nesidiocoris tenuis]|uniref:Uncharacterized protein n=1 Tax=Nesidiocoris tenuis TaxID=355587 RepID=A0A6H5GNY1_9HEMI|nr:unnamed protein product [Nesidiocoris tenuis]
MAVLNKRNQAFTSLPSAGAWTDGSKRSQAGRNELGPAAESQATRPSVTVRSEPLHEGGRARPRHKGAQEAKASRGGLPTYMEVLRVIWAPLVSIINIPTLILQMRE